MGSLGELVKATVPAERFQTDGEHCNRAVSQLDVVVKVTERCNIACTYCYYFEDESRDPHSYPARMSLEVWEELMQFLLDGVLAKSISRVAIIFHGGEPLLIGQNRFDAMCASAISHLNAHTELSLVVQTNAVLITPAWIKLFKKYKVDVGVSIDGPAQYNDIMRVDHKRQGTHAATSKGIKLLMEAADRGDISRPGALAVMNPDFDPSLVFNHLVDDLEFGSFDVLFPHLRSVSSQDARRYGEFLCGLFDCWVTNPKETIYIRIFRSLLDRIAGRSSYMYSKPEQDEFLVVAVASDGTLRADDVVMDDRWPDANIRNTSLVAFMSHPLYMDWISDGTRIPEECKLCCWSELCRGGHPYHRYENDGHGFNRKSVYCEALMEMYAHVSAFMLKSGYPLHLLAKQVGVHGEVVEQEAYLDANK